MNDTVTVKMPAAAWKVLYDSLKLSARSSGSTPELRKMVTEALAQVRVQDNATEEEIEKAREKHWIHSDDDIEIDEDAIVVRTNGDGTWVSAWVWFPGECDQ